MRAPQRNADDVREQRPRRFGNVTRATGTELGNLIVLGFARCSTTVNVVSDGGDHAFLIDTKTHGAHQRKGIGTRVVRFAAQHAETAGCTVVHSDSRRQSQRSASGKIAPPWFGS